MCPTKCQVAQADKQERVQDGLSPPGARKCTITSCLPCLQRYRRPPQAWHTRDSTSQACRAELAGVLSTEASTDLLGAVKVCSLTDCQRELQPAAGLTLCI